VPDSQIPTDPPGETPEAPRFSEFAHPEAEVPQDTRRYPSTIGGMVYLVVLAATVAGIGVAAAGRWRLGIAWVGGSLLAAAVARLVLPESQSGMLHVRRRLVDVALLIILGGGLLVSVAAVPTP